MKLWHYVVSDQPLNRVFSSIDSSQFETCFIDWVNTISTLSKGQAIAIDGKALRGAESKGKKSPVHMVSAWANQNNLVLGQVKVNEKSNKITAIPVLLDTLLIEGNIITIDAMGTQTNITNKIIKNGADYILAVKENQEQLLWVYFCANNLDSKRCIYKSRQLVPKLGGGKELVIEASVITGGYGIILGVGEPTLTQNGDTSFVVIYGDLNPADTTDVFDCAPWFSPKNGTPLSISESDYKDNHSINIFPNPTSNILL